ncbi:MAG: hypothetical protein DVS81_11740 [Candidatus Accumulibacter meliphilus]|uniref:SD-repeat containing protein B domain-containing protein n=1 Tax=Candidatus Accumulibacter meliphilus TaxID=2211374 RepID=A0A369XLS1_9PROT|nr:MAG: hypothetical protein DVS81_11740 [Candidatus Accumulibacter meliphilus]
MAAGQHSQENNFGELGANPGIDIEKTTNGASNSNPTAPDYDNEDAVNGAGVPVLTPGSQVTWTYQVTNTGNTSIAAGEIAIVDDNGTLGNTADDLTVANGKITYLSGDLGGDNILSAGETWLYQAMGTVQDLTTAGASSTFNFSGNSVLNGTDGNVRTYTAGGISVHVSAFSRVDGNNGVWAQAWLGSYGGGLGVTDSGEGEGGSNTHTVDNMGGRGNYVLFEFDQQVIVDSAFLGYVVKDSDLQIWIGTRPDAFNNHDIMLSDADLTALGFTEVNTTNLSTARLADLNAGNLAGNVLVIAADTTDCSPEDMFKIEKLVVETLGQAGIYENRATVTAQGVTDTDLSHYTNADVDLTPGIDIEKTTNGASNSNPTAPDYDNEDAAHGAGVPILTPGSKVTWTYEVTNTGNTSIASSEIAIVDDNGTVANTADDLTVANGKITYLSGDLGGDNILSAGETWLYQAMGTVQDLTTAGASSTFNFSGSSSQNGTDGNVRTYTAGGISVHVSAFSRVDGHNGAWSQAWLGSYGGGLGVTDSGEGSGGNNTHTVDNTGGRDNYVLFEFDQQVIVDSAFLGYVVNDSDLQIWIGTRSDAFNNHDTMLSDAELTALGFTEVNTTTLSTARLADLNAGNLAGNVLVIAADTTDCSPEDMFKIEKLVVETLGPPGIYENRATVTAQGATDTDLSHYTNPADVVSTPGIDIEKFVNGIDVVNPHDLPAIAVGADVTFTYTVKNTGNVAFSKAQVLVVDDNGTADDSSDDFTPTLLASSDVGGDGILSAGETWQYRSVTTQAKDLSTITESEANFVFSGSTSTTGAMGNVRTFSANGLSVDVSGVSRDGSGNWAKGYVGVYGSGLGVTNATESRSNHRVDNGSQVDYLMFEFDRDVVVDRAFLNAVVSDSDISIWIGDRNGADIALPSDGLLSSFFSESNFTSSSSARWADLNNGELSGDTLIISAYTGGSNDQFKVNKLDTAFIEAVGGGAYRNIATVTAGDVSDSDASGYKNSAPVAKASLGDKVWCDTNANGLQDVGEAGVAGVTVKLLDAANVVTATTVTDTHGNYSFADLNPGNYSLKVVKPTAYGGFTEQDKGGNSKDALDSDVDSTGKSGMITLLAGENNTSWDAGLTPPRVNIEYNFNGSSATDGGDGNVRSYTAGGVTVTARAVSSHVVNKANVWETAWLGAYSGGHGVTDRSEGSGSSNNTHTVDNVGRINYVIYQFSENVVVDKAYLGYVIGDSDLTAWIGSSTGTLTNLSDSLLAGMSKEDNTTSSSSTRWGDINATEKEGNILVIAASTLDSTPDYFKIQKLAVSAVSKTVTPIAIDLDGNGIQTTSLADAQGEFDLFGTGGTVKSGWLSATDAFLAFDADGNGRIDDISELFGGSQRGDGFARLAAFDSNGDGLVDAADESYVDLSVWRDANGNHETDSGELISLADAGVVSLKLAYHEEAFWDASGNLHLEQSAATLADGRVVDMTDVYFSAAANDGAVTAAEVPVSDPGWMFA